jgi:acetyl esterase/lipase
LVAARGATGINVNYRLVDGSPGHNWPAPSDDVIRALAWFRAAFDPEKHARFCLVGFSAGAQIAVKVADAFPHSGVFADGDVPCVIDNFGPLDLNATTGDVKRAVCRLVGRAVEPSCEPLLAQASELTRDEHGRSFLIVQGDDDKLVDVSQARALAPKLLALGACAKVVEYHGGHAFEKLSRAEIDVIVHEEIDFAVTLGARAPSHRVGAN